jgi:hypothetical protein
MATRTLLTLRDHAKERANLENSSFVSDTEWNRYINYSISELRDFLISKAGDDYFATSEDISLSNVSETYPLPVDFYKALSVELLGDDGYFYKMKRFEVSEQNQNANVIAFAIPDIRYRLRNNSILFNPKSALGGRTARLWYVPLAAELSADADSLSGYNGWDEFIVLKSARKALVKEEQDTTQVDTELLVLMQRIEAMAENRDQAQPMRIQDTERRQVGPWG